MVPFWNPLLSHPHFWAFSLEDCQKKAPKSLSTQKRVDETASYYEAVSFVPPYEKPCKETFKQPST